jgi:N-acetylneuraminic acid mutarotase
MTPPVSTTTCTPITDACTGKYGDRINYAKTTLSDGKIFISGGQGTNGCTSAAVGKNVELYDPSTNTWEKLPDMPVALRFHAAVEMDSNRIFVSGGLGTCKSSYIYNRTTKTWTS